MGVFNRPDSPWWWLWLETAPRGQQKEKTKIRVGTTVTERHDSQKLAEQLYHKRMNELAARVYRLPTAQPTIRFTKYAATYATDILAHRRDPERERGLLKPLTTHLGEDLLQTIDQDRARAYMTARLAAGVSARTVNREVDLLKGMLRDAVPKYLETSPLVGMKRLRVVPPKRRLMTPAEERKLLAHADPVETALLLLGLYGLVRQGDILDVRRDDRHGHWLYIADPKSGEPYEAVLTRQVCQALDAVPDTGPYYFARYRGAKTARDRRARVRRVLMKLCAKAHVKYGRAAGGITFHWATRKTGATRLVLQQRAPIPAVQRQGNWKKPDVLLAIYAEANRAAQSRAIRALPRRSRSQRKRA